MLYVWVGHKQVIISSQGFATKTRSIASSFRGIRLKFLNQFCYLFLFKQRCGCNTIRGMNNSTNVTISRTNPSRKMCYILSFSHHFCAAYLQGKFKKKLGEISFRGIVYQCRLLAPFERFVIFKFYLIFLYQNIKKFIFSKFKFVPHHRGKNVVNLLQFRKFTF